MTSVGLPTHDKKNNLLLPTQNPYKKLHSVVEKFCPSLVLAVIRRIYLKIVRIMANMEAEVQRRLGQVAQKIEEQVDTELEKLQKLKVDDIQSIRDEIQKKRKARMELERRWRENGHGAYEELPDEKAFFEAGKKSDRFIVHFYRGASERCKIVDHHLKILAAQHVEARFCKIDAEKSPFLCDRLAIRVLPCMLLLQKNIVVDRIIGFTDLGNRDDFNTEMLEWRLALKDIIEYEGDKYNPPDHTTNSKEKRRTNIIRSRNIRGGNDSSSDSDQED